MAKDVGGNGINLIVVTGGVDGGEHREQRLVAVQLVVGAIRTGRPADRRLGAARGRRGLRKGGQRGGAQSKEQIWNTAHGNLLGNANPPVYSARLPVLPAHGGPGWRRCRGGRTRGRRPGG